MSTAWIRVAYGVVLGLVLLFTVSFGSAMVFPGPKPPEAPGITFRQLTAGDSSDRSQNQLTASVDKYYDEAAKYREDYVKYQRNSFLLIGGLAVLLALIGLVLPAVVNFLRWGFLVGAGLCFVWAGYLALHAVPDPAPAASSLLALLSANEPKQLDFAGRFLRFAIAFVGMILLLFVGLWRLTEWPAAKRTVATTTTPAPAAAGAWTPTAPAPAPAPAPAVTPTAAAMETTRVISETPPSPSSPPSEQWQRPSDSGPAPTPESGA
jgi:hypothetical protein